MKTLTGILILLILCSCSKTEEMDAESSAEQIERYNKPIDAAGAAADQVQQIRDQQ